MSIADKLTTIAQNQEKVYDKGYITGRNAMINRSLNYFSDTELTTVGAYAFAGMPLWSVSLPNVTTLNKYSFRGCSGLREIDLPNLTTIRGDGDNTFAYCEKVTRYNLPKLKGTLNGTFICNHLLERLELVNDVVIGSSCFLNCENLTALILGASAKLQHTNAFNDTPIKGYSGYIYVPDDMVDTYKTATNWVMFASQIKGYSDLPTEQE